MNIIGTSVPAPASPRGFWMHTYFEMQGQYLVAKCYLVAIDTPVFFELKIDTTPILNSLRQGHNYLHSQVAGEGIPVNLIGAKKILVNQAANAAQAITRKVAEHQPVESSAAHAAYAAANSLLASVERRKLIDHAARNTRHVSEEVQRALPLLQKASVDGRVAGEVIKTVIGAAHQTVIGANQAHTSIQAQRTEHVLRAVHNDRNHLRQLGEYGISTGLVVDEHGNIKSRLQMPIPGVKQSVPQLAAAISGEFEPSGHATIVGIERTCVGCESIGCY